MIIILLPVPIIGGIIPVQTETYEHTISGLLGKRTDLFNIRYTALRLLDPR
jgi:hypothetical protein